MDSQTYGFRYRFKDRNWALAVEATSEAEARQRVAAMASAEFLAELHEQPSPVLSVPDPNLPVGLGLSTT